jgi:hypothetical protein
LYETKQSPPKTGREMRSIVLAAVLMSSSMAQAAKPRKGLRIQSTFGAEGPIRLAQPGLMERRVSQQRARIHHGQTFESEGNRELAERSMAIFRTPSLSEEVEAPEKLELLAEPTVPYP